MIPKEADEAFDLSARDRYTISSWKAAFLPQSFKLWVV